MSRKPPRTRAGSFHWESRQDLYSYFGEKHHLGTEVIDVEIARAMRDFKPRQGAAIQTRELWEKVGRNLARRCRDEVVLYALRINDGGKSSPGAGPAATPPEEGILREPLRFPRQRAPADDAEASFPDDAA